MPSHVVRLACAGLMILVAEQNARAALRFAQRALVLEDGRLAMEGAAADLTAIAASSMLI